MPVFNSEKMLPTALESILVQTFPDFEFVVVDDASTDSSRDILQTYAKLDSRIRLRHHPQNRGTAVALNTGLELARSEYLARMDADDVAVPERLELQVSHLDRHSDVGVLGSAARLMTASQRLIRVARFPLTDREIRKLLTTPYATVFCHPAVMMRTELVRGVGGYRPHLNHCEDYDLWLRISGHTSMENLSDVLLHYRVHTGQATFAHAEEQALAAVAAHCAAELRAQGRPDPFWREPVTAQRLLELGCDVSAVHQLAMSLRDAWRSLLALT